jgi:hypothetical protein
VGGAILVSLAAVATGVFLSQFQSKPALNPLGLVAVTSSRPTEVPPNSGAGIRFPTVEGMTPLTPPESYDSQSLSDKIDGKAELYLSAGFKNLISQRLAERDNPEAWVELFLYDMEDSQNAFGVYSAQRRNEARPTDLTEFSYETNNALFFAYGRYYVEIIGSQASTKMLSILKRIGKAFIRENSLNPEPIPELALFPETHLVKNSVSFIPSNAFGYDRMNHIFAARYRLKDGEVTAYLSHRKDPEAANQLASDYHAFLLALGGKELVSEEKIQGVKLVEIMDTYELILSIGPFLAGVHEAPDRESAESLATDLYRKLSEAGP